MKKKDSPNIRDINLHIKTALEETGDNWEFLLGDYNKNGTLDLYCIKKSNTGTNSTEVRVLNGEDNFKSFLLDTGTALPEVGDCYVFQLEDYNNDGKLDLYCIKKFGNESNSTEINIISGIDNLQSLIKNIRTKIPETNKNYSFCPFKDRMYVINKKGFNCTDILCLKI